MKTIVDIRIDNKKVVFRDFGVPGDIPEPRETSESFLGNLDVTEDGIKIYYHEIYDNGETVESTIIIKDDIAMVSYKGDCDINLVFKQGEACDCFWNDGYKSMSVRVKTKSLKSDLCSLGGRLEIDYSIEIMGNLVETNVFSVSVYPVSSIS